MKVLLSIKPEFAEKILDGSKKYEFRKAIFKNKKVKKIIIYASSPVKKVVGEFHLDKVLEDDLEKLWSKTKRHAGITKDYFNKYFILKDRGYAIKIKTVHKYQRRFCLKKKFNIKFPPQSFIYLS